MTRHENVFDFLTWDELLRVCVEWVFKKVAGLPKTPEVGLQRHTMAQIVDSRSALVAYLMCHYFLSHCSRILKGSASNNDNSCLCFPASQYSRWLSRDAMVKTWKFCLWKVPYLACIMYSIVSASTWLWWDLISKDQPWPSFSVLIVLPLRGLPQW